MMKRSRICIAIAMMIAALLPLASCSSSTDDDAADVSTAVQIALTIKLDDNMTRANDTWGDVAERDAEDNWENKIDPSKLQVLAYDKDNKLVGEVKSLSCISLSGTDKEYMVIGTLDVDNSTNISPFTGKFVVLANYDSPADVTVGSALSNIGDNLYSYDVEAIRNQNKYIPMWGIHSVSDMTLKQGISNNIGDIDMLRAMAKIRVKLSDEENEDGEVVADNYTMSEVYLDHYCENGYTVPKGFDEESSYVAANDKTLEAFETKYLKWSSSSMAGLVVTTETKLDFKAATTATTGKEYIVYMPEYPTGGTVPQIHLSLTNSSKVTKSFIIELKNYSDGYATGEGLEILRNSIYEYTITKIKTPKEVEVTLKYQVMYWGKRSESITFN